MRQLVRSRALAADQTGVQLEDCSKRNETFISAPITLAPVHEKKPLQEKKQETHP
jgi:hypothetical protein